MKTRVMEAFMIMEGQVEITITMRIIHGRFRLQMPQISMLISPFLMLKQIMTICIFMMEPTPMPHKLQEAHLQAP